MTTMKMEMTMSTSHHHHHCSAAVDGRLVESLINALIYSSPNFFPASSSALKLIISISDWFIREAKKWAMLARQSWFFCSSCSQQQQQKNNTVRLQLWSLSVRVNQVYEPKTKHIMQLHLFSCNISHKTVNKLPKQIGNAIASTATGLDDDDDADKPIILESWLKRMRHHGRTDGRTESIAIDRIEEWDNFLFHASARPNSSSHLRSQVSGQSNL